MKNLQQKLKKEINLRLETNKKLKQSNKEICNLKSYISKLEKKIDQMKKTTQNTSRQFPFLFFWK